MSAYSLEEYTRCSVDSKRAHALFYYTVSKFLSEKYGWEGGLGIRKWIRAQGNWRGEEMKKAHTALGWPIDVEHIQRFWDNALSDFWFTKVGKYTSHDVAMQVHNCGYNNVWVEKDWLRWGQVYCEEIHQAILEAYNPDGCVVIPRCLTKGDACCDFRWILTPGAKLAFSDISPNYPGQDFAFDYLSKDPCTAEFKSLRRGVRLFATEIQTIKQILIDDFSDEGILFDRIMENFAEDRVSLIKQVLTDSKQPLTAELIFHNFDIPFQAFGLSDVKLSKDECSFIVDSCPLLEGFSYFKMKEEGFEILKRQYDLMSSSFDFPYVIQMESCEAPGSEYKITIQIKK